MTVPSLDKELGIEVYATKSLGVGGAIREVIEDFVVEEVLVDGSKASVNGPVAPRVLGCTREKQKHLLCVMVKRSWDTLIAIKNIARQLGIDQSHVQIAGIKDAKAVTAQHLTIEGGLIEDMSKVNIKDIELLPLGYVREALSTYYLLGNCFTIIIKGLKNKNSTVRKRIRKTVKELETMGGIPNFFGHQRFGTTRPITHLVGRALNNGDFEGAAMLFLAKASIHEHPASQQAREKLKLMRDYRLAYENFPKQLRFERLMLSHLADKPEDFVGAFRRLPIKLQELFLQAHQSYLFNRFLSERLKHGYLLNKAEVGDYVVGVERSELPLPSMVKTVTNENMTSINEKVDLGRMRVALPIVGLRQKLSEGGMGDLEKKVLEKERINLKNLRFNIFSKLGGKGGLRAAATPIRDFKLDIVTKKVDGGQCQAQLSFMLLRGSYATVLLREIMKPSYPIVAGF